MPYAALALSLLVLSNPSHPAAADPAAHILAAPAPEGLTVSVADWRYGDWEEDDKDNVAPPEDRDDRYGNDDDDGGGDSANGPSDDDDGWSLDPYEHTERA